MDNLEFEVHKVKNEIKRHKEKYMFFRREKNEFNEPVGEKIEVCEVSGIYHEEMGYVPLNIEEGAIVTKKPENQILCIFGEGDGELEKGKIEQDDIVYVNGSMQKVTKVVDIQNYGIIANISLELVL